MSTSGAHLSAESQQIKPGGPLPHSPLPDPSIALISPQVKESLKDGILSFTKNSTEMLQAFEDITQVLGKVDKEVAKDWELLEKQFRDRLLGSRELASDAAKNAKEFGGSLLPFIENARLPEETQKVIRAVNQMMDGSEKVVKASKENLEEFQQLRQLIVKFLAQLGARDPLIEIISQLRKKVDDLLAQIKRLAVDVLNLCNEIGLHYIFGNIIVAIPDAVWHAAHITGKDSGILARVTLLETQFKGLQRATDIARHQLRQVEDEFAQTDLGNAYVKIRRLEEDQSAKFVEALQTFGVFGGGITRDCEEIIPWLNRERTLLPMIINAYEQDHLTIYDTISRHSG